MKFDDVMIISLALTDNPGYLNLILLLVLLLARIYYFSFLTRSYISHEKRERDEISLMVNHNVSNFNDIYDI